MKNDNPENQFDLFYLELPQADYLNDLSDIEIQDAYDEKDQKPVLRKEDVDKLRDDILGQPCGEQDNDGPSEIQLFDQPDPDWTDYFFNLTVRFLFGNL